MKSNPIFTAYKNILNPDKQTINLRFMRKIVFNFSNYIDNYKLYNQLKKYSKVCRTNDVKVNSAHKFSLMAATGVYEYNVYFQW